MYDDFTKAYRVYEPKTRKILITRDVVFDKNQINYYYLKLNLLVNENPFDFSASHLNIKNETNNRED